MQDTTTLTPATRPYPVRLSMAYPERLSRLSTFFRIILAVPVFFFLYLFQGSIVLAIWAAIVARGRIPHWLFDFQVAFQRFTNRASAYVALLTDKYPPFEGDWDLAYEVDYPQSLSRWRVFVWKVITALPHFIVLAFLYVAAVFVVFIGWWAILFTGSFPRGLHRFVVGVPRWSARVTAYFESLTDELPPFSLNEDAGPGGAMAACAAIGGVLLTLASVGSVAGGIAIYTVAHETKTVDVSLAQALSGDLPASQSAATMDRITFTLAGGDGTFTSDLIRAMPGYHLVEFEVEYLNGKVFRPRSGFDLELRSLRLATSDGIADARLLTADGVVAPVNVVHGRRVKLKGYFEVRDGALLTELQAYPAATSGRHIAWTFTR